MNGARDAEEDEEEDEEDEDEEEEPATPSADGDGVEDVTDAMQDGTTHITEPDEPPRTRTSKSVRFYDPNQDESERREVKRKSRALEREFIEHRDQYMRNDDEGLTTTIQRANEIFRGVKQTADATTDSRLLVGVSDVAHRKSAQLALGDNATGIDVDEFVSKAISYMRRGAQEQNGATASQRRRQRDDDDDEDTDFLDWTYLGARACFPYNSRPAVPGFLLGPLSMQKRVRAPTQRRARQRDDQRAETRPEALQKQDLEGNNETSTVRHACAKIKHRLTEHAKVGEERIYEEAGDRDLQPDDVNRLFRKHRMTDAGGPSLFDFVVNPRSFGQTVENLFYISFLIKEGEVGVQMDGDGLPALVVNEERPEAARERNSTKHQAVFGIDYATWQQLVQAYEIKESLIPHRDEGERAMGARGWYS
ncbi:non-structural maintenance of chromosome element 4 [Elsinoe australis]|uniref:Non-structural maintenance of chromosomes element 4 n=1 Tax=Elsinoe australis TaxID=40998 RepID=A0A4U7BE57_9PEZI|nr:non-structural maintenance of chromosome element 4 [Elsinoe australis]